MLLCMYREQYSTIHGFIPSNLWGTENKRNRPCGVHGRMKGVHRSMYYVYECVCVCVCVCLFVCVCVCVCVRAFVITPNRGG